MSSSVAGGVSLENAQRWIAGVWLGSAAIFFAILIVQSTTGHYGDGVADVWQWALPCYAPTLGMILTVLGATALQPQLKAEHVNRFFFTVALGVSIAYIVSLFFVIFIQPVVSPGAPMSLVKVSNYWLAPMQGVVSSGIVGVFFARPSNGTN